MINQELIKGSYVMVDKIITQDETFTSQNRLLTSKIVGDLSASNGSIGTWVRSWTPSGTGFTSEKRNPTPSILHLETLSAK